MKTVSRETALKLVAAGVTREGYFVWVKVNAVWRVQRRGYANPLNAQLPAWTACELLEVIKEIDAPIFIINLIRGWLSGGDLAEIMAYRIIYLLTEGHVTAEEINQVEG